MSSEANEIGLEKLLGISWRAALQRYSDETMHAPATVAAYLAYPCARIDLQVRLAWCLMGIKKAEYEASNDSKSKEQELELMKALRVLISRDDSAICPLLFEVRGGSYAHSCVGRMHKDRSARGS